MKVLAAFLLLCVPAMADDLIGDLQAISVTIKAGDGQGSGTIFSREGVSYIWTCAHVVEALRTTRKAIVNGGEKTVVEFKDAKIVQEFREDGRNVGETSVFAQVIRYSDAEHGEDLALLKVRKKGFTNNSVVFYADEAIPPIGTELYHVGSLLGQFGSNSLTAGLISQIGRILDEGKVFDQTTATSFPGSSGGGIYLKADGRYVGMLTQAVRNSEQFNFVVPIRRIRAWAKQANVEWALDKNLPMPSEAELKKMPVEDAGVEFQAAVEKTQRSYPFLLHREGER
jgi:hypothetical protein